MTTRGEKGITHSVKPDCAALSERFQGIQVI